MQSKMERDDAEKTTEADAQLKQGNIAEAEAILLDVCSRCPDNYEYEFVEGDTRYIKFWDATEFMNYSHTQIVSLEGVKGSIVWINSAYPRACYLLGFVYIEKHNFLEAIRWLAKGQSIEPQNPKFLLEYGAAYFRMGQHQRSFDCYQQALHLPGITEQDRAMASATNGSSVDRPPPPR